MTYLITPTFQFIDESGNPLVNGYIEVYNHETRDKVYTFADFDGTLNEFRVRLNSLGQAIVLVDEYITYDVFVYDSIGSLQSSRVNVFPSDMFVEDLKVIIPYQNDFSDIDTYNVILKDSETIYQLSLKSDNKVEFTNTDNEHLNIWTIDSEDTWTFESKELSGQSLTAESPVKIESDVIKVDTVELKVKAPLTFNENTMEIALDPTLCTINIDAITDWIDITDEWEFINGFRLSYLGNFPGDGNAMTILYSPTFHYVKFTGTMRVNRTSDVSDDVWKVFLRYNGNRFYTSDDTVENHLMPQLGYVPTIGAQVFIPGTNAEGTSTRSILKLAYVGAPTASTNENGLGIKIVYNHSGSVYGCICTSLVMKVVPKE